MFKIKFKVKGNIKPLNLLPENKFFGTFKNKNIIQNKNFFSTVYKYNNTLKYNHNLHNVRIKKNKDIRYYSSIEKEAQQPNIPEYFTNEEEKKKVLTDEQIIENIENGEWKIFDLEKHLKDYKRAVKIRRMLFEKLDTPDGKKKIDIKNLPWQDLDYSKIYGTCCENVIGYIALPVGIAGPVMINGEMFSIPMATAEGCLVASTHRGCKAINEGGGAGSWVINDGMTRGPVLMMPSVEKAKKLKEWIDFQENVFQIASAFNSTSRFARLSALKCTVVGRYIYIRFKSTTGDAMGMNMISKGVEKALGYICQHHPQLTVLSVSGNYCTDKKPAAINWIEGRGKSVVAEAVIPEKVVKKTLKTTVDDLIQLNIAKNLIGSAAAGSIGGFNAHASNIVTAMFLATGQDPAQNVESSQCITLMEKAPNGVDLHISVTMPCIEVGTIGGGTGLPAQKTCLQIMGLQGTSETLPGSNSRQLAQTIAVGVLAGELSLMSALAAGHLVRAHMVHNRGSNPVSQKDAEDIILKGSLYAHDTPSIEDEKSNKNKK
eukprot:TRINITY_DN889_c0_g1_i2.p1 TRINITY_DN889_c0_g1~~TRINITY_DN889_c0_g1_i2.p1  ORF type:complete len:545 (+),score=184.22 TRINITY_DN889_c0_g1_i2:660-2294(+)